MTATTTESETDEKPTVVTAELLTSFVTKVYNQEAAAKLDSVEFVLYDDEYVLDHDNNATDASTAGSERETMLFIPGLDFSGVSAIGQYPALASKYELWWCRVESDDRTPFATLADTVAAFVAQGTPPAAVQASESAGPPQQPLGQPLVSPMVAPSRLHV